MKDQIGQPFFERRDRRRVAVRCEQQVGGRGVHLLGHGQLSARQRGEVEGAQLDERQQAAAIEHAALDALSEVEQTGERAEGGAHGDDVPRGLGAEAANRGQGHADGADGLLGLALRGDAFECVILDGEAIGAAVHARAEHDHAPAARLLDGSPEAVVGRAAVVEHVAKERRGGFGVDLGACLGQHVLGERQGVSVGIQVAGVFLQQRRAGR